MKELRLRKREERRVLSGHLWIYSNEVDVQATPLKAFAPGELAAVTDSRGRKLATAYVNPKTLLAARILDRRPVTPDAAWFARRLNDAQALRERIGRWPCCRWVNAEADGLPGLVIDVFDDVLVVQIGTAGMEALRAPLLEALEACGDWRGILLRNDTPVRELEGLSQDDELLGAVPERIEVPEGGCTFSSALAGSQKTGWYYDQHDNRERFMPWLAQGRVLDAYSYVGAWGVRAGKAGAADVTCVDSSAVAADSCAENAERNGVGARVITGDALEVMEALAADKEQFESVLLDPPPLVRRRKDLAAGVAHYTRVNAAGLRLVSPGGLLITASCSFHLSAADLVTTVTKAAGKAGRRVRLLARGGQGADHPIHPAIAETEYLKSLVFVVR